MSSEGLSSGLIQFSPTSSFVPWEGGDVKDFRVDVRPDLKHWGGGRPALKKSLAALEKELMRVGGQPECTYYVEHNLRAKVKLAFDYEKVVPTPLGEHECYSILEGDLLRPMCDYIRQKTTVWMLDDVVILSCHRKVEEHRFKISRFTVSSQTWLSWLARSPFWLVTAQAARRCGQKPLDRQ